MDGVLEISGERIVYELVRNMTMRNTYMRFEGEKLVVISPSYRFASNMLEKHKSWIIKHYKQIKESVRILDRNSVSLSGKKYIAVFRQVDRSFGVEVTNDCIIVSARDREQANELVERWIRKRSQEIVEARTIEKARALGVRVNKIGVRRSHRWGTCTSKGIITYNPYVAGLPEHMVEYIVSHEVSHLKQMNHSRRFWEVVGSLNPEYKATKKQLHYYDNKYRPVFAD